MTTAVDVLIEKIATELSCDVDSVKIIWEQVLASHPLKLFKAPSAVDFNHQKMRPYFNFIKEAVKYYQEKSVLFLSQKQATPNQDQQWALINTYLENYYIDWTKENDALSNDQSHFQVFILVDKNGEYLQEQLGYLEYFVAKKLNKTYSLSALDLARFVSQSSYDHQYDLSKPTNRPRIKSYPYIREYYQLLSSNEVIPVHLLQQAQKAFKPVEIYILLPNGAWCLCHYQKGRHLTFDTGRYDIAESQLKPLKTKLTDFFNCNVNVITSQDNASRTKKAVIYSGFDILSLPKKMPGEQESRVISTLISDFPNRRWNNVFIRQSELPSLIFAAYFLYPQNGISFVQDLLERKQLQAKDLYLLHGESIYGNLDNVVNHPTTRKLFITGNKFTQPSFAALMSVIPESTFPMPIPVYVSESNPVPADESNREELLCKISKQYANFDGKNYRELIDTLKQNKPLTFDGKNKILSVLPPLYVLRDPRYHFIFHKLNTDAQEIEDLRQELMYSSNTSYVSSNLLNLFQAILGVRTQASYDSIQRVLDGSIKYFFMSVEQVIQRSIDEFKELHEFMWDIDLNASECEKKALCEERYYFWFYINGLGLCVNKGVHDAHERILDRVGSLNFINALKFSLATSQYNLTCDITNLRLNYQERQTCLALLDHHPTLRTVDFKSTASFALRTSFFQETADEKYLFRMLLSHSVQKILARNTWLHKNEYVNRAGQAASDYWHAAAKYALVYLNNNPSLLSSSRYDKDTHSLFKMLTGQMGVPYLTAFFDYLQDYQTSVKLMLGDKCPDFWIGAYQAPEGALETWVEAEKIEYYAQLQAFLLAHFARLQQHKQANKTIYFPFGKLVLPYSTLIAASDYAYCFEQASQSYPDLDALVLDAGDNIDYNHCLSMLQAIDQQLLNGLKPTTLLRIPCLDDDALFEMETQTKMTIGVEDYLRLRALYRDINHRILTYSRQKQVQKLLMNAKVMPVEQFAPHQDNTTLPFRRSTGKQYGLEYQHQMVVQQQQEQEVIEDHDDVLSSRLVTVSNIESFKNIVERAKLLDIDENQLPSFFRQWVGIQAEEEPAFAFYQMTERAFLMLLDNRHLFKDGLHATNLPQGFHRLEDHEKQWVLDYQPLKKRTQVSNEFTVCFHTKKDSPFLLGHYRDFLVGKKKPDQMTPEALRACLLFSSLASAQQNQRAFDIVQAQFFAGNYAVYGCAFIQLIEDFGLQAFDALSKSNLLLTFNPLNTWIEMLALYDKALASMFTEQGYTQSDLVRWGQVYQQYGMEGVSTLIGCFDVLKTQSHDFFVEFKTNIIDKSTNFCEFLDSTSGVQTVLQEIAHCQQMTLWLAVLKQHSVALQGLSADEMVQLWKAFCAFQKQLLMLNVTFDSVHLPENTNMLLWMSKVLDILKHLPAQDRQAHVSEFSIDNLRHAGSFYKLLFESNFIETCTSIQLSDEEEKVSDNKISDATTLISQELSDRMSVHKDGANQLAKLQAVLSLQQDKFTDFELRFRAELLVPHGSYLDYPVGFLSVLLQEEHKHFHLSVPVLLQLKERLFNHERLNRLEQLQVLPLLFIDNARWDDVLVLLDKIPPNYQSTYLNGLEKITTAQALQDYLFSYDTLFSSAFCHQHPDLLQDWLNALNHPDKQKNAIDLLKLINEQPNNKDEWLAIIGRLYASPALIGQASPNESCRKCKKIIDRMGNEKLKHLSTICIDYPIITADAVFRFLKQSEKKHLSIPNNQNALEIELLNYIGNEQPRRDYGSELRKEDYDRIIADIIKNNPAIEETTLRVDYQLFQFTLGSLELHNKPLSALQQQLKDVINNFSKAKEDLAERLQREHVVLAIVNEVMYRATGKYPKLTQQLSLLIRLFSKDKPHVFDMDTGEGKAILMHILAALDVLLQDKTVDIIHYKRNLVERDVKEFAYFYPLLKIKTGAVTAGKPRDVTLQVHNGTLSDLRLSEHLLSITTGQTLPSTRCAKIDESDVLHATEEQMLHKLAIPGSYTVLQMAWFYEAINAFYDANQQSIFNDVGEVYSSAAKNLLQYLVGQANDDPIRLEILKLYALTPEKQASWLIAADDAARLKENVDFILTQAKPCLSDNDVVPSRFVVPISAFTKEPLEGMSFSDGVQQLHVTRLNQKAALGGNIPIHVPVQSVLLSADVGEHILSVYDDIEEFTATPIGESSSNKNVLHIPTNYPSLREHQPSQLIKNDEYIATLAGKIRTCLKNKRSMLISCENNAQSIALYSQIKALFSKEEHDSLMCFTQEQQTAESFLAEKKSKESKGLSTVVFSATFGRGDNPDVQEIIISYVPHDWAEFKQILGRTARKDNWGTVGLLLNEDEIQKEICHLTSLLQKSTTKEERLESDELLSTLLSLRQDQLDWLPTSENYQYYRLISVYSSWQLQLFGMYLSTIQGSQASGLKSERENADLLRLLRTRLEEIKSCWETFKGKDNAIQNIQSVVLKYAEFNEKLFETYLKDTLVRFVLPDDVNSICTHALLSMEHLEEINPSVETEIKRRAVEVELPFWETFLPDHRSKRRLLKAVTSVVTSPELFSLWPKLSALTTEWLNKAKAKDKQDMIVTFWQHLAYFKQNYPNETAHLAAFLPTLLAQSGKLQFELLLVLMPRLLTTHMGDIWCNIDDVYFEKLKQALALPVFSEPHQTNPSRKKRELLALFDRLAQRLRLQTPVDFEHYVFSLTEMTTDYLATVLVETTAITNEHAHKCFKQALSAQEVALIELSRRERAFYHMVNEQLSAIEPSQAYCKWVQAVITESSIVDNVGYLSFLSTVLDSSATDAAIFNTLPDELEITLLPEAFNNSVVIQAIQHNKAELVNDREKFKAILRIVNCGHWQDETSDLIHALLNLSLEDINKLSSLLVLDELQTNQHIKQAIICLLREPTRIQKRLNRLDQWANEPLSKRLFFLEKGVPPALQIPELSSTFDSYEKLESYLSVSDVTQFDNFILKHKESLLNACSAVNILKTISDCIMAANDEQRQLKSLLLNQLIRSLDTQRQPHEYEPYLEAMGLSYQALLQRSIPVDEALHLLINTPDIHEKVHALYQECCAHQFSKKESSDLLYLLLMRSQQDAFSSDEFNELIDSITCYRHHRGLPSIRHRLTNQTARFSLQEQTFNQPKDIIYTAASALESNTWQAYFQLTDQWQMSRPVRVSMMRMIGQDRLLPIIDVGNNQALSFWQELWAQHKTGDFINHVFQQYHYYLCEKVLTAEECFAASPTKDTLKSHGFFSVEQSKTLYQHAQEIKIATENSNHVSKQTQFAQTTHLSLLQAKLLECVNAYSGFFSISPSRRHQRNEIEAYIRTYLSQTTFNEHPYIHLMNYLADKLVHAQVLDQAKAQQLSFHKKGYSRLNNMIKTMQDHVIAYAMQETAYEVRSFQEEFKTFAYQSNVTVEAVLETLKRTLRSYSPIRGEKNFNSAMRQCKDLLQSNSRGEALLTALSDLSAALEGNTSIQFGKLQYCVSQALYYCKMTCESETAPRL